MGLLRRMVVALETIATELSKPQKPMAEEFGEMLVIGMKRQAQYQQEMRKHEMSNRYRMLKKRQIEGKNLSEDQLEELETGDIMFPDIKEEFSKQLTDKLKE